MDVSTWAEAPAAETLALLQAALDELDDVFILKDLQHRWIACNQALCRMIGRPRADLIGRSDPDFMPPAQAEQFWAGDDAVVATGQPSQYEEQIALPDGTLQTIWTRKFPTHDAQGRVNGVAVLLTDISQLRHRELRAEQLEQALNEQLAIIQSQQARLDELAVPVIQVWESILLLPLIGAIENRRMGQIMENLLTSIGRAGAQIVIIDITGVPVVDTSVASHLIRSVQAAALLGCRSILVGISPEIAQTLVGLGVDFSQIITRATLQNGLEFAFQQLRFNILRTA